MSRHQRPTGADQHDRRLQFAEEAKTFFIRIRTNDDSLRKLVDEAHGLLADLEAAIARHDRVSERMLAFRAARLVGIIDSRLNSIGANRLFAQLGEIDEFLKGSMGREARDVSRPLRPRGANYAGEITGEYEGPGGERYLEQLSGGKRVYHDVTAFAEQAPPKKGDVVVVEYDDPSRAVVRANFIRSNSRSGERVRTLSDGTP